MGKIQDAINVLLWKKEEVSVVSNNRQPIMWWVNNQNTTSLKSLHVWLNYDGTIRVWLHTHFALLKKNYVLASALRFIAWKVWWYGFKFVDKKGNVIEWTKADREKVSKFFGSMNKYIFESLTYLIASWQKVSIPTEVNKFGKATSNSQIMNLDPRMLVIDTDPSTWDAIAYRYSNRTASKTFDPDQVNDYILYPDFDRDNYGQSIMDSIIIDAVTDSTTSNRQLYFYMNNATPSTVYITDGDMLRDEQVRKDLETKINEKYGGNANVWKPLVSTAIKDVKTIEIPNIDVVKERDHIMRILAMVFWVDPRVLWYMKETWWSYAEIDAIARNMTNSKIQERAAVVETIMNQEYNKYVWELPYKIKLDNILFTNVELDKKMSLEELKAWVITAEEYKELYDL